MKIRHPGWLAAGAIAALAVGGLWWWRSSSGRELAPTAPAAVEYVGNAACARCHAEQTGAWRRSHHALAMQDATPATVLGDFGGATFRYGGDT